MQSRKILGEKPYQSRARITNFIVAGTQGNQRCIEDAGLPCPFELLTREAHVEQAAERQLPRCGSIGGISIAFFATKCRASCKFDEPVGEARQTPEHIGCLAVICLTHLNKDVEDVHRDVWVLVRREHTDQKTQLSRRLPQSNLHWLEVYKSVDDID